jgi:hypothetical protein
MTIDTNAVISQVLVVQSGATLTIDSTQLVFLPDRYIDVKIGGKLIVNYSFLHGCNESPWDGIRVTGDRDTLHQLVIFGSVIEGADVLVDALSTADISVVQSTFRDAQTALKLTDCLGFDIRRNDFSDMVNGIETYTSGSAASQIIENYFADIEKGIQMTLDDHDQLDILCNVFDRYTEYGIHSSNCQLKDQGNSTNSAGNVFYPNSTNTNHHILHRGNNMNYYYGPSDTITMVNDSVKNAYVARADYDGCEEMRTALLQSSQDLVKNTPPKVWNVPNPASNSTTLHFTIDKMTSTAVCTITNIYGNEIMRFPVDLQSGQKEMSLETFANGIYFYTLIVDGRSSCTGKMIISK